MTGHNRTVELALVVIGAILLLVCAAGGVLLKFYEARADAEESCATFDGDTLFGPGEEMLVREGTIWQGCPAFFAEPFETAVFVFGDGSWMSFTTQHGASLVCPISVIVETIRKRGRMAADALFCVHNHFTPAGFTPGDKAVYRYLKGEGFRGVFAIFYSATGKFKPMEDK